MKIKLILVVLSFFAGAKKKAVLWVRLLSKMSIFGGYLTTIISSG